MLYILKNDRIKHFQYCYLFSVVFHAEGCIMTALVTLNQYLVCQVAFLQKKV